MLTMICGIPNAGKTTYSKQFDNALHLDEIGTTSRVIEAIKQIDGNVVIEGYFGTSDERSRVRAAHNGYAKCIFLDVSVDESLRREDRNRHAGILRNAARFFQPPTYSEGWDEIIVIGDNDGNIQSRSDSDAERRRVCSR